MNNMVPPRRVLHVAAGNLFGGVETFLVTLAKYRATVPQLVSEFALCFEGRLADALLEHGAKVHWLGNARLTAPLTIARANLALARILEKNQYSAVIVHGAWPHVLVGAQVKLRGKRLVTWAHGAPLEVGLLDRVANRIRPDLMIVNSHHTRVALGQLFQGVPSRLVYYPVEPHQSNRSRADVRNELKTSEGALVIAFAGRFERWKGHDLLLRAAKALLHRSAGDWCIWMCGGVQRDSEKQYYAELRGYVKSHRLEARVQFLGPRTDVPDVLRAADIFCQPNTGPEPFGIVFIEALYAGLPVVATNMGGAAEIVSQECGILTEPTPTAVADALFRLLSDAGARRSLGSLAWQRANELCEPTARIMQIAEAVAGLEMPSGQPQATSFPETKP